MNLLFQTIISSFLTKDRWNKTNLKKSIENTIFWELLRKKYRKKGIWEKSRNDIFERIQAKVQENNPIHIIIPFGWFKHFRNSSAPETNRAEFFHILNTINYVKTICEDYEPWVIIEYLSEDFIVPYMNNYSKEEMNRYHESFQELVSFLKSYFPDNFTIKYSRVSAMCDEKKVYKRVLEILDDKEKRWESLSREEKIGNLKRSFRSVITSKKYDRDSFDFDDTKNEIIKSRLLELAYYDAECEDVCIWNYFFDDNKIMALFSFGVTEDNIRDNLTLWSIYNSVVDFWIGQWILQKRNLIYSPRIISHKQYISLNKEYIAEVDTWIHIDRYKSIEVYTWKMIF